MKLDDLRVRPGSTLRLRDRDTRATFGIADKSQARDRLETDIKRLIELQDVFAAARTHGLLIVLQGLDSSGKDGAIKHVMSGVNPQGVDVYSFKQPNAEELAHDFLWRSARLLPQRGHFAIFNRSYYEDVAVVRVHPELLANEGIAARDHLWQERYDDINAFEEHLARNNTIVLKFFLHISKDEQRERLLDRLDDKSKNWKFSPSDLRERRFWDQYQTVYEEAISATSTERAPWYVIPADRKWFSRLAIAGAIVERLERLDLKYPRLEGAAAAQLAEIRKELS